MPDNYSDVSSVYNYYQPHRRGSSYYADDDTGSLVRSLSQPSLARSASEFTENNWGLRIRSYEDGDDLNSSPDHTPRSSFRSPRFVTTTGRPQQQRYSEDDNNRTLTSITTTAEVHNTTTNTNRRMFGGRTVSAAEWFHDSDENDATYKWKLSLLNPDG